MELERENLCCVTVAGEVKHDEVVYVQIRREIICQQRVPKLMKLNANANRLCEIVYWRTHAHSFLSVCLLFPSLSGWCEVLRVPARAQVGLFIASGTQADLSLSCLFDLRSFLMGDT